MNHQSFHLHVGDPEYPPQLLRPALGRPPGRLTYCGDPDILRRSCLGVLSSREVESGVLLAMRSLFASLAELQLTFVGGWRAPAEAEALRLLSPSHFVVGCLAKGLPHAAPPDTIRNKLADGRAVLLSHCEDSVRRVSRERSLRANEIAVSLSRCVLVLSGPRGSGAARLVARTVRAGAPVAAVEHFSNEHLRELGAEWASRRWIVEHVGLPESERGQEETGAANHN